MIAKLLEPYHSIIYLSGTKKEDYRSLLTINDGIRIGGITVPKSRMVIGEQTQSNHIHVAVEKDAGAGFVDGKPRIPVVDGFVTQIPHLYLVVRSADCVPILFFDPKTQTIGIVHCGREGTRRNAAGAAIQTFRSAFKAKAEDIIAVVAPMICENHYEVDTATFSRFEEETGIKQNFPCLDLRKTVHQQLLQSGVLERNIEHQRICTFEDERYFSYRRDGTKNRQLFLIGIHHE
jgi:polyphenol oxidase